MHGRFGPPRCVLRSSGHAGYRDAWTRSSVHDSLAWQGDRAPRSCAIARVPSPPTCWPTRSPSTISQMRTQGSISSTWCALPRRGRPAPVRVPDLRSGFTQRGSFCRSAACSLPMQRRTVELFTTRASFTGTFRRIVGIPPGVFARASPVPHERAQHRPCAAMAVVVRSSPHDRTHSQ